MKILKHGNTIKTAKCENCFCEIEYNQNDIKDESRVDEYHGDLHSIIKKYIKCPECVYNIYIKYEIDGESIID